MDVMIYYSINQKLTSNKEPRLSADAVSQTGSNK